MDTSTDGRRAWVTGAGQGIGRELALRLAARGWTVAISARSTSDLAAVVGAAVAPGRVVAYPHDVADMAAVSAAYERIEAELGPLDLAILNAGTHIPVSARGFDREAVRRLVDVNLMGTVNGLAALLPGFVARGSGQIAVVASVAGYRGLPTAAGYAASKAGLIALCEALRPELDAAGVDLKLVNPGFVDTPLTRRNRFRMPFIIPASQAAEIILARLRSRRRFEIAFPWRMAVAMKLLRLLPYRAFFWVTRRRAA